MLSPVRNPGEGGVNGSSVAEIDSDPNFSDETRWHEQVNGACDARSRGLADGERASPTNCK